MNTTSYLNHASSKITYINTSTTNSIKEYNNQWVYKLKSSTQYQIKDLFIDTPENTIRQLKTNNIEHHNNHNESHTQQDKRTIILLNQHTSII